MNKKDITLELAVEQLRRIGFKGDPYEEVKKENWYTDHEWPSVEMENEFKKWALKQIKDTYKFNDKVTANEFSWWNLGYGLKSCRE